MMRCDLLASIVLHLNLSLLYCNSVWNKVHDHTTAELLVDLSNRTALSEQQVFATSKTCLPDKRDMMDFIPGSLPFLRRVFL